MEITYFGHSSFRFSSRSGKVITDPFDPSVVGLKFPKTEADIITVSHEHPDHNYIAQIGNLPLIVRGPGEYEVKGIKIIGVSTYHDAVLGAERGKNTVYRIEMDGISILHCGDLGHKFEDKELEMLDGVDVVIIPVGGIYTVDAHLASEIISQLDPKIVIPMHYRSTAKGTEKPDKLAPVDDFLKEMGKTGLAPVQKLVITKDKLPAETTIVVLE